MARLTLSDIAKPDYVDNALCDQFAGVLLLLFEAYPVSGDDYVLSSRGYYGRYREKALEALANLRPDSAAYLAADTGVPNELILGAYRQLFFYPEG